MHLTCFYWSNNATTSPYLSVTVFTNELLQWLKYSLNSIYLDLLCIHTYSTYHFDASVEAHQHHQLTLHSDTPGEMLASFWELEQDNRYKPLVTQTQQHIKL